MPTIVATHPSQTVEKVETPTAGIPYQEQLATLNRFVRFFCEHFRNPSLLRDVPCRDSYKRYVPRYYAGLFGEHVEGLSARHLKWLRRLEDVLSMPRGSTIVDIGGGYGADTLLLAAFGYRLVFYEITPNHVEICRHLRRLWEAEHGAVSIRPVLARRRGPRPERFEVDLAAIGHVDAVLLDEVAHHVEPVEALFELCSRLLGRGGHLFLLEPNFWCPLTQAYFARVRGFHMVERRIDEETGEEYLWGNEHIRPRHRWRHLAEEAGFRLRQIHHIVPYFMKEPSSFEAKWRRVAESLPFVRSLVSTHLSFDFEQVGARRGPPSGR